MNHIPPAPGMRSGASTSGEQPAWPHNGQAHSSQTTRSRAGAMDCVNSRRKKLIRATSRTPSGAAEYSVVAEFGQAVLKAVFALASRGMRYSESRGYLVNAKT